MLVIEFSQIFSIKYSYLTNRIIALSLIRWTNKRILSYSVESDGFSKKNGGVSRRGRIDCSPQANYAFSRILGSEAATRYWMTVRGTVRPAAWPSRSETRGTAGSGVMSSLLRKGWRSLYCTNKKVLNEIIIYRFYLSKNTTFRTPNSKVCDIKWCPPACGRGGWVRW